MELPETVSGQKLIYFSKALLDRDCKPFGIKHDDGEIYVLTTEFPINENSKSYEEKNFITEEPIVINLNVDLGRNAARIVIMNDGPGKFTISISKDGKTYGDPVTMKSGEIREYHNRVMASLKIIKIDNSAYRIEAI
jgi:hypothetical protein